MSDDYADGGVHTLTSGSSELKTILAAAARRSQLVLVDFSASWCGPCRAMEPVLRSLASEHRGRLAVIKVDCESTAANQDLAATSRISAFPTFHLFRNQQKVAEMRGANQAGLRQSIQQQLAQLGPATGAGAGRSGVPGPVAAALAAALARVKTACTFAQFVTASRTLLTFVGNALDHPGEEKYRRIKLTNTAFQSKLGCRAGGKECMAAIGFREINEAGEQVLVMTDVPQELPQVRQLLQQALQQAEAAASGAAAAERRIGGAASMPQPPTPTATPAASISTSAGGGTGGSGVDPTTLAAALAAALGNTSGSSSGSATGMPLTASAAQPGAAGGPRVTPKAMARLLAQAMQPGSSAGTPPAPAQRQQQEQRQQELQEQEHTDEPPPGPAEQ